MEDSGESAVICRDGEAVADLVPHKRVNRIKTHSVLGRIKLGYDPIEPLSSGEGDRDEIAPPRISTHPRDALAALRCERSARPVWESLHAATASGVPATINCPP